MCSVFSQLCMCWAINSTFLQLLTIRIQFIIKLVKFYKEVSLISAIKTYHFLLDALFILHFQHLI
jgi:hypothetical protein